MFLQNYAKPTTNWVARDMQRQRDFVDKYMRSIDVPHWYRGLSSFQYKAASNLLHAIRDDLEQDTSHRVRDILNRIGLQPPMSKENVRFVMKLSRGNDLAFLWFLKDLHYTTDEPGYNTNEQLILSCIAYLDLIFTIRGLDNVLPAPQPPKHKPPKRKMSRVVIDRLTKRKPQYGPLLPCLNKQTSSLQKQYKLPYLERQRRPRPYGKSLTARPPVNVLQLKILDALKDPNYVIPNEFNRWFSNYEPQEGRKTANSLINENLDEIFETNVVKIPSQVFESQLFKQLRLSGTALRRNSKKELGRNIICEHHKVMQEMEKSLELELRVIALEKCRKYFDLDIPKKEKRIARLRKQIENDVNLHLTRFRELADKSRSQLLLWSKDELQMCNVSNDTTATERASCDLCMSKKPRCRSLRTQSECHFGLKPKKCKSTLKKPLGAKSEYKIRTQNLQNTTEPEIIGDCLYNNNVGNYRTPSRKSPRTAQCGCCSGLKPKVHNCDSNYDYVQHYDYGHSDANSETRAYFNAPHKHTPFKFDYQKIFDIPFEQEDDINIKKACVAAIRSEECLSHHHAESRENIDAAIKNCTRKTMEKEFKKSNKRKIDRGTEPLIPSAKARSYYDPNDKALMHQMLKEAIERLAQDTRYVLAALPDAHKLPVLRYWIYQRYGKVYTQKEMSDNFKTTALLFRALLQMQIHGALPLATDLGRAVFIDYSCHNYLMRKCDRIRDLFYKRIDSSILNQCRNLYVAMTPYIFSGRSLNKTIFAYLPSRPSDIQHFRVWSPRDCRPRKGKYDQLPATTSYY